MIRSKRSFLDRPLSRRAVLRGLGGVAIGLPFLDAMRGSAHAQTTPAPLRFLVWYTPNGTVPANFWPTGGERDFTLSPILAPLERHRDRLMVVRGVDLISSLHGPGDAHQKGTGHCLTATELQEGDFPGDAGASAGWAGGISIDQKIADHVGATTPFRSLEFGVLVDGAGVKSRISYRGPGQPLPPENDPAAMHQRIFKSVGAPDASQASRDARRKLMVDAVLDDYRALHARLGRADRLKLDAHIESVANVRERLDKTRVEFGGACQPLDLGAPFDPTRAQHMPAVGGLQMDLMAMALACDLTRVASLMWTRSTSEVVYSWLGDDIREGHHPLAHKGDEDTRKVEQNTRINTWYADQFAGLMDRLAAIPEGDGSVLDNTIILWTDEQRKGNNHARDEMPYVIGGGAGGRLRMGRYVQLSEVVGHNRLMVTLQQAMGIAEDTFGNPAHGTGPLTALT